MKYNELDDFDAQLHDFTTATRNVANKSGCENYQPTLYLIDKRGEGTLAVLPLDDITFTEAVDAYINREYRKIAAVQYLFLAKHSMLEGKPIIYITGYYPDGKDNASIVHFDDECTTEYFHHDNPGAEDATVYARIVYECAMNLKADNP